MQLCFNIVDGSKSVESIKINALKILKIILTYKGVYFEFNKSIENFVSIIFAQISKNLSNSNSPYFSSCLEIVLFLIEKKSFQPFDAQISLLVNYTKIMFSQKIFSKLNLRVIIFWIFPTFYLQVL